MKYKKIPRDSFFILNGILYKKIYVMGELVNDTAINVYTQEGNPSIHNDDEVIPVKTYNLIHLIDFLILEHYSRKNIEPPDYSVLRMAYLYFYKIFKKTSKNFLKYDYIKKGIKKINSKVKNEKHIK